MKDGKSRAGDEMEDLPPPPPRKKPKSKKKKSNEELQDPVTQSITLILLLHARNEISVDI